jgi:hypothetical protein
MRTKRKVSLTIDEGLGGFQVVAEKGDRGPYG